MPTSFLNTMTALPIRWVICLCADWCGVCRDYRAVLNKVAAGHADSRFAWIDIEDDAHWVGEMDIETFPTLLVADTQGIFFLGPLTPHAVTVSRLLTSLQTPDVKKQGHTAPTQKLLDALPTLSELWL